MTNPCPSIHHGYKAKIISTVVDYTTSERLMSSGYKAKIISTVVDMESLHFSHHGYKAKIISTVVDINV